MNHPTRQRLASIGFITASVIVTDLVSKALANISLKEIPAVEPVTNPGLLLGVANPSAGVVLLMAAIGLVAFGGWCIHRTIAGQLPAWLTGLVLGGAAANLIDRVLNGEVRDFLSTPWVIFNLADVAIFTGVAALAIRVNRRRGSAALVSSDDDATPHDRPSSLALVNT